MRKLITLVFLISLFSVKAQSPDSNSGSGIDSLNATFVSAKVLVKQDMAIVNGTEFIEIVNVNFPTEVRIFDINGKEVYKSKIDQKTKIDKEQFEKGFYVIKTRSVEKEMIKKLYL
jgi:hypothetical protein